MYVWAKRGHADHLRPGVDQIASKDDRNTRDRMIKEILKAVETQSVIDSKGRDALYVGTNEDEDKKKLAATGKARKSAPA